MVQAYLLHAAAHFALQRPRSWGRAFRVRLPPGRFYAMVPPEHGGPARV